MTNQPITVETVTREYDNGVRFNSGIDLYDCVETNENFFIGRQWEGVQANGLPTPVFNFLKRVVLFAVANVSAGKLVLRAKPMSGGGLDDPAGQALADLLTRRFAAVFEENKLPSLLRSFCRNAAVDGDGCLYAYWDENAETGDGIRGAVRAEVLRSTQVLFGNPNTADVQTQPYILIERRLLPEEARQRARAAGVGEEEVRRIVPDGKTAGDPRLDELGGGKVTALLRLWRDRDSGEIHGFECTRHAVLRPAWNLGVRLYPLVWMNWDAVPDCYHGQAMLTGLIPNQIFVNKLFAMSMISLMTLAYPKVLYDRTRVAKWSNRVGAQIAVAGSVEGVAKVMDPAAVSPQISQFIDLAVGYTQRFLGASDAALGDARPENTSAILVLQRASNTPLELVKQNLMQCIEDFGRICGEFQIACCGVRTVEVTHPVSGQKARAALDFSRLRSLPLSLELEVGASSYWSEIAAMQTLDNLLLHNKISTAEYLKRLPAGQITDRDALVEALEAGGQEPQ